MSHEQVSVGTALDRLVNLKMGLICTRRLQHFALNCFMSDFKGVSAKHLQNYLYWFKFIEIFKSERESIKIERAYVLSQANYTDCSV